jgi:hypothetical protein
MDSDIKIEPEEKIEPCMNQVQNEIQDEIITPSLKQDISDFLKSRIRWRTMGIIMETTSKIMLGASSILTFTTSIYPCNTYLSFIAGTVSTISLVSLQFANYSFRESKMSTTNLNILLEKLHLERVPELNTSVLRSSPTSPEAQISVQNLSQI